MVTQVNSLVTLVVKVCLYSSWSCRSHIVYILSHISQVFKKNQIQISIFQTKIYLFFGRKFSIHMLCLYIFSFLFIWWCRIIYLWRTIFVLFCNYEIHWTRMLHIMFLMSLESFRWGGVHGLSSMTFGLAVQKFLNIEWFLHLKSN